MDKTSGLCTEYVKTPSEEEAELSAARFDIAKLGDQESSQRGEVSTHISGLAAGWSGWLTV